MIFRFHIQRFRFTDFYHAVHELGLVVVIDCRDSIFDLVVFNEGESPVFLGDLIQRYLYGLYFPEGTEKGEYFLLCDFMGEIANINRPSIILFIHDLCECSFKIYKNKSLELSKKLSYLLVLIPKLYKLMNLLHVK